MLYLIFAIHYVADFVLQSRWMAENKSSNVTALMTHVSIYSLCFLPLIYFTDSILLFVFLVWNFVTHCIIDFFTSQWTTKFYQEKRMKAFWNTIGFDQFLHVVTLMGMAHICKLV